ncbi:MAG: hypothetical protein P4L80_11240 [Xanthobacteraceae bacterium]|nr:hypothetical protein [Xanthobacteraceae bacterium]
MTVVFQFSVSGYLHSGFFVGGRDSGKLRPMCLAAGEIVDHFGYSATFLALGAAALVAFIVFLAPDAGKHGHFAISAPRSRPPFQLRPSKPTTWERFTKMNCAII